MRYMLPFLYSGTSTALVSAPLAQQDRDVTADKCYDRTHRTEAYSHLRLFLALLAPDYLHNGTDREN